MFAVLAPPNADRLRCRLGIAIDAPVELVTTGWCKLVVLVESYAVLVPRHHDLVAALRREIRALRALEQVGLPGAPRLFEVVEDPAICPLPLVVTERVSGASLAAVEPELGQEAWIGTLSRIGAALAMVHGRASTDLPARPPADHRRILHGLLDREPANRRATAWSVAEDLGASRRLVDELVDALQRVADLPRVTVHNDLHEDQVLVDDDGAVTGLIDWQTSSVDHPFVDFDLLQWGRGALTRFGPTPAEHRRALWDGGRGDERHWPGAGELLEAVWTLNDAWWATTSTSAPVTGIALPERLRAGVVDRGRALLESGRW